MVLAVSALDVALIAALGSIVVGFATSLFAWLSARAGISADLNARIYEDKRDAYAAVALDAYQGVGFIHKMVTALDGADDESATQVVIDLDTNIEDLNADESEMLATFVLLAPNDVRNAWDRFIVVWNEALSALSLANLDRSTPGLAGRATDAANAALDSLSEPLQAARNAMRDDLYSIRMPRRRTSWPAQGWWQIPAPE